MFDYSPYPNIVSARSLTASTLEQLEVLQFLDSADTSLIVYGSIGRGEVTHKSDADWVLLLDGQAVPEHAPAAQKAEEAFVGLGLAKPGRTGTFGALVSSHELVHHIAGTRDSNENLTRRILLLLESRAITQPLVRTRVLRHILDRYIVHDTVVPSKRPPREIIPHFLLNDIVRYWRTMASDYAAKMWERDREEWAIRNVKLRFSRKLIFIAGLLTAFSFELDPPSDRDAVVHDPSTLPDSLASHIAARLDRTPLDVVSEALLRFGTPETTANLLASYDGFLAILSHPDKRATLASLRLEDANGNPVWQEAHDLSRQFRAAVQTFFLDENPHVSSLIKRYAIF